MNLDFKVFEAINQFAGKNDFLDITVILFTKFGPLLFILFFISLWFSKVGNRVENRQIVLFAFTIAFITLGIDKIIELSLFRPRPFVDHSVTMLVEKAVTSPSFPSNHTAGSFALAIPLFWKSRKIGTILLGFAGLMALSRIFSGVHYPTDVLMGAFIAIVISVIIIWQRRLIEPLFDRIIQALTRTQSHVHIKR